jgi:HSP20 family molecular chaperone IbpA
MVLSNILVFDTIQQMLDQFFYRWDDKVKPPIAAQQVLEENNRTCKGVKIQFAVAGYKKEDIEVFFEKNLLYVKGDNTKRIEVDPKFRSMFTNRFPVSKELDLSKAEITLEDGLLTISIPLNREETCKTFLFGGKEEKLLT